MTITAIKYAIKKGLPKMTKSICPECGKILDANIFERDGKVYIEKSCHEHGDFCDVYWSDVDMYLRAEKYAYDGVGLYNPMDHTINNDDCVHILIDGQRIDMMSCTAIANLDLTNRCNMRCPICFANANNQGYVYEPTFDEIHKMLVALRSEKPIKCTAVQFAGGEPTVHPDFIKIIKDAKNLGFAQIQVATNGMDFQNNYEFIKDSKKSGLNTIYLSFDGVSDDIYIRARGRKMLNVKIKVIENCRKLMEEGLSSPSIVLVPTIVMGMNDHQIGDIIKFALNNSDVVRGVNFQPVAFTGRVSQEKLSAGRFTLPDLIKSVEEQTGFTNKYDWYPVPVVAPISKFASIILGQNKVTFTTHPHCGVATYLFQDGDGNVVPFPRFVDVERFSCALNEIADKAQKSKIKKFYLIKLIKLLNECVDENKMPNGLTKKKFIEVIKGVMSDKSKDTLSKFSWKMMLISGMHFQDRYNYDIERIRRCGVHYITPELQIIPFCAYNSGPEFRNKIEREHSIPIAEWVDKHKELTKKSTENLIISNDQKSNK